MNTQHFEVIKEQSSIGWTGRKVTGAHDGTIDIREGRLVLTDGKLSDGRFVIDTTSIRILDISDPATNAQFAGHLASEDFFASERYPEAWMDIRSVADDRIEGDLTIKGITHPVSFNAVLHIDGDIMTATAKIVVDRTRYAMRFRSGNFFRNLGDTLIYNDFDLNIQLTAKAVA